MYQKESISFLIEANYASLRASEKKTADYILENPEAAAGMGLSCLAQKAGVSQPTVVRFAKALGFKGYKEFQHCLLAQSPAGRGSTIPHAMYGYEVAREEERRNIPAGITAAVIAMLEENLKSLSADAYEKAVDSLLQAEKIEVYGVENSHTACSDLCTKLTYLGLNCRYFTDTYLQRISAENLKPTDAAVGISYSGSSRDTVDTLKAAKKQGAVTIALTNFRDSPLSKYADYVLCSSQKQFFYGDAIFSRTTQLAVVDMLYMGILVSDYTRFAGLLDKNSKKISDRAYR